jgi:hypothetical protein
VKYKERLRKYPNERRLKYMQKLNMVYNFVFVLTVVDVVGIIAKI